MLVRNPAIYGTVLVLWRGVMVLGLTSIYGVRSPMYLLAPMALRRTLLFLFAAPGLTAVSSADDHGKNSHECMGQPRTPGDTSRR